MFNRRRCKKCKYHMRLTGGTTDVYGVTNGIMCGYSLTEFQLATEYDHKGKFVRDKRGEDPKNCKLFKEGKKNETH